MPWQSLLASLSKIVAGTIGKPEQYVMVAISPVLCKYSDAVLSKNPNDTQ